MPKTALALLTAIAVVVSLLLIDTVQAQGTITLRRKEQTFHRKNYLMLGGGIIDMANLNTRLGGKGYRDVSEQFLSIGLGGYSARDGFLIGGEAHQIFGDSVVSGGRETSISGSYGFINVGYIVYSAGGFDIYPVLGAGLGRLKFKIREDMVSSFDEVLENPERSTELSTRDFLINLALGMDYVLRPPSKAGNGREHSGLVIGLRAGYSFAPSAGGWKEDGTDILNGPETGVTGPYIRVLVGGTD